ncbi:hypothetical protein ACFZDB_26595 [Streptomyces luteogriseus]|uniref:hypothetical protein n=1 Tax=Streptomyces TaxID=1883 RepID=UPI0004CC4237|nr:hypothetical protein [Streptomyces sp. NRRL S-475]
MAAIVVVHGIGKQYSGANSQHVTVSAALLDGLSRAGLTGLQPDSINVAFYGHLFRPPGAAPAKGEPWYSHQDVVDPFEVELLMNWWAEAHRIEPDRVPPPAGTGTSKAITPQSVQRALSALSRSRFFARAADRFLIGMLKQVRTYLTTPDVRARVQSEIATAVTPDTRVIVGHSLGSVIAYEALCAHPEWPVRSLVTLGSPLGIANLVFDRLLPEPRSGRGSWPGGVRTWTNLCDRHDVVSLTKRLAPLFGDPDGDHSVRDLLVDNGWQAHAIEPHLTAVETGEAIVQGLQVGP